MRRSRGRSRSMLLRLWVRAPRTRISGIDQRFERETHRVYALCALCFRRPALLEWGPSVVHEGHQDMARGVNKVILIGNLGADPETRAMPSGSTVANLRIATSESWRDKQTGEQQERTEWHRVALFGRLAEIASEYLRKGSQVYIEGSLRTRKWQDKQGN